MFHSCIRVLGSTRISGLKGAVSPLMAAAWGQVRCLVAQNVAQHSLQVLPLLELVFSIQSVFMEGWFTGMAERQFSTSLSWTVMAEHVYCCHMSPNFFPKMPGTRVGYRTNPGHCTMGERAECLLNTNVSDRGYLFKFISGFTGFKCPEYRFSL